MSSCFPSQPILFGSWLELRHRPYWPLLGSLKHVLAETHLERTSNCPSWKASVKLISAPQLQVVNSQVLSIEGNLLSIIQTVDLQIGQKGAYSKISPLKCRLKCPLSTDAYATWSQKSNENLLSVSKESGYYYYKYSDWFDIRQCYSIQRELKTFKMIP